MLAPHAADRALIVPGASHAPPANLPPGTSPTPPCPSRLRWTNPLARVLLADAQKCPRCGARMQWVAALTDPHSIRTYLTGVGPPAEPPIPPQAAARLDPVSADAGRPSPDFDQGGLLNGHGKRERKV